MNLRIVKSFPPGADPLKYWNLTSMRIYHNTCRLAYAFEVDMPAELCSPKDPMKSPITLPIIFAATLSAQAPKPTLKAHYGKRSMRVSGRNKCLQIGVRGVRYDGCWTPSV